MSNNNQKVCYAKTITNNDGEFSIEGWLETNPIYQSGGQKLQLSEWVIVNS